MHHVGNISQFQGLFAGQRNFLPTASSEQRGRRWLQRAQRSKEIPMADAISRTMGDEVPRTDPQDGRVPRTSRRKQPDLPFLVWTWNTRDHWKTQWYAAPPRSVLVVPGGKKRSVRFLLFEQKADDKTRSQKRHWYRHGFVLRVTLGGAPCSLRSKKRLLPRRGT